MYQAQEVYLKNTIALNEVLSHFNDLKVASIESFHGFVCNVGSSMTD